MQRLYRLVAILDVLLSFAELAVTAKIPYVRPLMFEKGKILFVFSVLLLVIFFIVLGHGILNLQNARHPCVEKQEEVSFISNQICLEKSKS